MACHRRQRRWPDRLGTKTRVIVVIEARASSLAENIATERHIDPRRKVFDAPQKCPFLRIHVASLEGLRVEGRARVRFVSGIDLAPKFYPVLSSPWRVDLPGWAVVATGAGAEPS